MEKNKIIFLDIDGVLNHEVWYKRRFNEVDNESILEKYPYYDFDPLSIGLINKIIELTDAKVVISSTWRIGKSIEELIELFNSVGFKGDIIDSTPSFYATGFDSNHDRTSYSIPRGCEIDWWLKNKGKFQRINWSEEIQNEVLEKSLVKNYIILDDDSDMLYNQREHFINIDSNKGITELDVSKSIKILNTPVQKLYFI
jgi:hypothetical protein